jgi:hypothetical protein
MGLSTLRKEGSKTCSCGMAAVRTDHVDNGPGDDTVRPCASAVRGRIRSAGFAGSKVRAKYTLAVATFSVFIDISKEMLENVERVGQPSRAFASNPSAWQEAS